jgi:hypothetical protein
VFAETYSPAPANRITYPRVIGDAQSRVIGDRALRVCGDTYL